jgi:hypothetical protein
LETPERRRVPQQLTRVQGPSGPRQEQAVSSSSRPVKGITQRESLGSNKAVGQVGQDAAKTQDEGQQGQHQKFTFRPNMSARDLICQNQTESTPHINVDNDTDPSDPFVFGGNSDKQLPKKPTSIMSSFYASRIPKITQSPRSIATGNIAHQNQPRVVIQSKLSSR